MMENVIWELPLKTVSEGNCTEHWRTKSKRHRHQQFFIKALFRNETKKLSLPCKVKMVRLGPRFLDADDNLRMAFKWIKDEISECLIPEKRSMYVTKKGQIREIKGRADSDKRITWEYDQEKKTYLGIRIEISFDNQNKPTDIDHELT